MHRARPALLGLLSWAMLALAPPSVFAQEPVIELWPPLLEIAAEPGELVEAVIMVGNVGEAGSNLLYTLDVVDPILTCRDISGTTLSADPDSFLPGTTQDYLLTVYNASLDFEWLTEIHLDCPPGVTVLSSTDFLGGTGGDLVTNHATGDGAELIWTDQNGGWGNIFGGESAYADITLHFAPEISTDLHLPILIKGDEYGDDPHEIVGKLDLRGPWEHSIEVLAPNGGEIWVPGEMRQLHWACSGSVPLVDLDLSRDGGYSWESLVEAVPNSGLYLWDVTGPLTSRARLRVSLDDGGSSDMSDGDFFIHRPVDWLSLPVSEGSAAAGEVDTLRVQVDAGELDPGQEYHAHIEVRSNAAESLITVPVLLNLIPTAADPPPAARGVLANHPNPFNPSTTLSFSLKTAGRARLSVHDLRGRLLRVLAQGELSAGRHESVWDGLDRSGRALPSGVYFARLESEADVQVSKLLLLK
jgi:hypothetical protein